MVEDFKERFRIILNSNLTDTQFWEDYWANCKLPSIVNRSFSFERCLANKLLEILRGCKGEILEVGCAPGKWLALASQELGLRPSGIEYTNGGVEATLRNLSVLGIEPGFVEHGDFFKIEPRRKFDVVLSLGFIEHFQNADEVVGRHIQWTKSGGRLILGIPNFRGIYEPIQRILDDTLLDKHNLDIMNLEYFRNLAQKFSLTPLFADYIGSFEPALFIGKPGARDARQFFIKILLRLSACLRRIKFLDKVNGPLFSCYILAAYEVNA